MPQCLFEINAHSCLKCSSAGVLKPEQVGYRQL